MSEVQAILFNNKVFTPEQARGWLKKHGHTPIKRVHKTERKLRYRLTEPGEFTKFATKNLEGGDVQLVIGVKDNEKPPEDFVIVEEEKKTDEEPVVVSVPKPKTRRKRAPRKAK